MDMGTTLSLEQSQKLQVPQAQGLVQVSRVEEQQILNRAGLLASPLACSSLGELVLASLLIFYALNSQEGVPACGQACRALRQYIYFF